MPIYEYRCAACGHELEAIQKISDAPMTDCPACGESALSKLVSAPGFRLKGGGWYETDFKKGGKRNLHESDSKKAKTKKADGSAAKKSESAASKKPSAGAAATK